MSNVLPLVGRTIHWQDGPEARTREIFVTGLDYGPNVERTAIIGRDYTEGDPFPTRVFPDPDTAWHYADSHMVSTKVNDP